MGVAIDLIKTTVEEVESIRNEDMSKTFVTNARAAAEKFELKCDIISSKRKRIIPTKLAAGDMVVTENIGRRSDFQDNSMETYVRVNIFFPVLDKTLR